MAFGPAATWRLLQRSTGSGASLRWSSPGRSAGPLPRQPGIPSQISGQIPLPGLVAADRAIDRRQCHRQSGSRLGGIACLGRSLSIPRMNRARKRQIFYLFSYGCGVIVDRQFLLRSSKPIAPGVIVQSQSSRTACTRDLASGRQELLHALDGWFGLEALGVLPARVLPDARVCGPAAQREGLEGLKVQADVGTHPASGRKRAPDCVCLKRSQRGPSRGWKRYAFG